MSVSPSMAVNSTGMFFMEYIVHGSKNQNDSKLSTYFGASLPKRMSDVFRPAYTGLDHALVVCDLTQ